MFNFKRSSRVLLSVLAVGSAVAVTASSASTASASSTTVSALRSPAAAPSGEEMPVGDLPGWHQVFSDDFTTAVPLGSFPAAVGSKWTAYPSPWKDTSGYGTYSPSTVVSVNGGMLNQNIHTDNNGVAMVSALRPQLGSQTYGRYAVRYRFDSLHGYKMAFMLWPDSNDGHGEGEVDFPEMNLDSTSSWAFMHRTNSTGPDDQAWFKTPVAAGPWHTAVIEWSPNLVVYLSDGVEVGRTSLRTPTTPMHWVMQTETSVDLTAAPDASVHGNVQIDWASVWSYNPGHEPTPPVVAVTSPTEGSTVAGNQTLTATASTDKGVLGVQFKVDGANLGVEDLTAPYSTPWNTALAPTGTHTVSATARDNAGNMTTVAATVTVDNIDEPTAPRVLSSVPIVNGTIFPVGANLNTQFSKAVIGVTNTSMTLKNTITGATIPATVTYTLNANQSIAVLNPTNNLTNDTKYTVNLTGAITDRSGDPLTPTSWSFVTGPAPTATPTTPTPNSTNVSRTTTITATASEDLTKVGSTTVLVKSAAGVQITGTISFNNANDTITFAPTAALAASTKYTVTLTNGIKDVVGNPLSTVTWNFTTGA